MALVAQLLVLLVPLTEGREERVLGAHVEAPRSTPHQGHRPESCPACTLLGVHGRVEEQARLHDLVVEVETAFVSTPTSLVASARFVSNSSRAPPLSA